MTKRLLTTGGLRLMLPLALVLLTLARPAQPTSAVSFVVNSTGDGGDVSTSDLACMAADGSCTLRAAIEQANFLPGPDNITFNIPPAGIQTIAPASALPEITDLTTIDGTTQPGTGAAPAIVLDGISAGAGVHGLTLSGGDITVRRLAIIRFAGNGILVESTAATANVEGNYIGLDPDGVTVRGNANAGVFTDAGGTIGGTSQAQRNVISGNSEGIRLGVSAGDARGNYIGTNAAGSAAVPNGTGVLVFAFGATIDGNLISGNTGDGIRVVGGSHTISNNRIGTMTGGSTALPNGGDGVEFTVAPGNTVGPGNTIAFNGGAGIRGHSDNAHLGNSIHSNGGLGVDFGSAGVNANDPGDSSPPQNHPVLTSATSSGGTTMITGTLSSKPNTNYILEFFSSPVCDASSYGEGRDSISVDAFNGTDASGNFTLDRSIPVALSTGYVVTAVATHSTDGNTSEFSRCAQVNCPGPAGAWIVPAGDTDCDGFTDANESQVGTDPNADCHADSTANNEDPPDRWPVDLNDNRVVNTIDVGFYVARLNAVSDEDPEYDIRFDLAFNGVINTIDVGRFVPFLNKGCSL